MSAPSASLFWPPRSITAAGIIGISALLLFSACATGGGHGGPGARVDSRFKGADFSSFSAIAVLDFHETAAPGADSGPDFCQSEGLTFNHGPVQGGAGESVADLVYTRMAQAGYPMMEREKGMEALPEMGPMDLAKATDIAQSLGADALVMGCVARFEDLQGSRMSAEKPAHVSFGVVVFDRTKGRVVWAGKFEKMQKSLFEDLFQWRIFFKGGMAWQSADKLSGVGADFLVDMMPPAR